MELKTVELDIYTYNHLVKTENTVEVIRKIVKNKNSTYEALMCIKAVLGIKDTEEEKEDA